MVAPLSVDQKAIGSILLELCGITSPGQLLPRVRDAGVLGLERKLGSHGGSCSHTTDLYFTVIIPTT